MARNGKFQRSCCACGEIKHRNEMTKIVKDKQNTVIIDYGQNIDGRGAYICKNSECVKKAVKKRALNRAFKCEVSGEIYSELTISENTEHNT